MTPEGSSGTPLARKLGIVEGTTVGLVDPPDGFLARLGPLPAGVSVAPDEQPAEVVVVFSTSADHLVPAFQAAMARIPSDGAIWVAWPKKRSPRETALTEDRLRDLLLATGMVDVKAAAIDGTWSGLRFVVRRELRARWGD